MEEDPSEKRSPGALPGSGGKSRYGRTRRPKLNADFCNSDELNLDEAPTRTSSPSPPKTRRSHTKQPPGSVIGEEIFFELHNEVTKIDHLGAQVANNFRANIHRDNSIRDRKFFKSSTVEEDTETERDVCKVLKLISASSVDPPVKSSPAVPLKTYSRVKKIGRVAVESFGLPDQPIVPPVESADNVVVTSIDLKDKPEPWRCNLDEGTIRSLKFQSEVMSTFPGRPSGNDLQKSLEEVHISGGLRLQAKPVDQLNNNNYCNNNNNNSVSVQSKIINKSAASLATPKQVVNKSESPPRKKLRSSIVTKSPPVASDNAMATTRRRSTRKNGEVNPGSVTMPLKRKIVDTTDVPLTKRSSDAKKLPKKDRKSVTVAPRRSLRSSLVTVDKKVSSPVSVDSPPQTRRKLRSSLVPTDTDDLPKFPIKKRKDVKTKLEGTSQPKTSEVVDTTVPKKSLRKSLSSNRKLSRRTKSPNKEVAATSTEDDSPSAAIAKQVNDDPPSSQMTSDISELTANPKSVKTSVCKTSVSLVDVDVTSEGVDILSPRRRLRSSLVPAIIHTSPTKKAGKKKGESLATARLTTITNRVSSDLTSCQVTSDSFEVASVVDNSVPTAERDKSANEVNSLTTRKSSRFSLVKSSKVTESPIISPTADCAAPLATVLLKLTAKQVSNDPPTCQVTSDVKSGSSEVTVVDSLVTECNKLSETSDKRVVANLSPRRRLRTVTLVDSPKITQSPITKLNCDEKVASPLTETAKRLSDDPSACQVTSDVKTDSAEVRVNPLVVDSPLTPSKRDKSETSNSGEVLTPRRSLRITLDTCPKITKSPIRKSKVSAGSPLWQETSEVTVKSSSVVVDNSLAASDKVINISSPRRTRQRPSLVPTTNSPKASKSPIKKQGDVQMSLSTKMIVDQDNDESTAPLATADQDDDNNKGTLATTDKDDDKNAAPLETPSPNQVTGDVTDMTGAVDNSSLALTVIDSTSCLDNAIQTNESLPPSPRKITTSLLVTTKSPITVDQNGDSLATASPPRTPKKVSDAPSPCQPIDDVAVFGNNIFVIASIDSLTESPGKKPTSPLFNAEDFLNTTKSPILEQNGDVTIESTTPNTFKQVIDGSQVISDTYDNNCQNVDSSLTHPVMETDQSPHILTDMPETTESLTVQQNAQEGDPPSCNEIESDILVSKVTKEVTSRLVDSLLTSPVPDQGDCMKAVECGDSFPEMVDIAITSEVEDGPVSIATASPLLAVSPVMNGILIGSSLTVEAKVNEEVEKESETLLSPPEFSDDMPIREMVLSNAVPILIEVDDPDDLPLSALFNLKSVDSSSTIAETSKRRRRRSRHFSVRNRDKSRVKAKTVDSSLVDVEIKVERDSDQEEPSTRSGNKSKSDRRRTKKRNSKRLVDNNAIKRENFILGDLVWAKLGCYPYWPCLVVEEPIEGVSCKTVGRKKELYHVRFFGDKGRRAWVSAQNVIPYYGPKDLENIATNLKAENKVTTHHINECYHVRPFQLPKWTDGVNEAESLNPKSAGERIQYFENFFKQLKEQKKAQLNSLKLPKQSVAVKRVRTSMNDSTSSSSEVAKKIKLITSPTSSSSTSTSDSAATKKNKSVIKKETSDTTDTDSTSKFSESGSLVPTSLESQAIMWKRNNIFKGIPKDKVCQVCQTGGTVLKCKGPCNGVYHYKCALNLNNETPSNEQVSIVSIKSKKPMPELTAASTVDDHMSLSEKIDLRMREIMKKIELASNDLLSSSSSDEPSCTSTTTTATTHNNNVIKVATMKKLKKHVTADSVCYETVDPDCDETVVKQFKCSRCFLGEVPCCLVCRKSVGRRDKCSLHTCGKYFHYDCLKQWPQTQWLRDSTDDFVCPRHVCHTCISDDPRGANSRCSSDKVVKCLKCPATYHTSSHCVPAGCDILSTSQIVCPRHRDGKRSNRQVTINANWCFICSEGGDLICCETCPTSVHLECMPEKFAEEETFYCEDCQSGRLPLYDEIVWVKLGSFRWWPARILFPNEVPDNVRNIPHVHGEYVVRFYGTYDHYWVAKGRTFLFQEGDKGSFARKRRVDVVFLKAISEATAAHQLKKTYKLKRLAKRNLGLKPPPYVKIKINKPVGNVRLFDGNISNTTSCDCDPNEAHPCGSDSNCLNRLLLTECNPDVCPAGERCNNQSFERRDYPPITPYRTEGRGWGLRTLAPIREGQFIIEYVGEMIDEREYKRRVKKMHEQKEENFYFLTIDNQRMLDAGPKGNVARFMNHSCQPNCETQKWTVNGDTRVGLFANCDIPANAELTFNYNLESIGEEKKICKCGAEKCSGFIGVKVKEEPVVKKPKGLSKSKSKKKRKSRPATAPSAVPETNDTNACFICHQVGNVGRCNNKACTKYYHAHCVGVESWPEGNKWICPCHNCNFCTKRTSRSCYRCINSYCPTHAHNNIRYDKRLLNFVCSVHDIIQTKDLRDDVKDEEKVKEEEEEKTPVKCNDKEETNKTSTPLIKGCAVKLFINFGDSVRAPICLSKNTQGGWLPSTDGATISPVKKARGGKSLVSESKKHGGKVAPRKKDVYKTPFQMRRLSTRLNSSCATRKTKSRKVTNNPRNKTV